MYVSYCQHRHHLPEPQAAALVMTNVSANYGGVDELAVKNINLSIPRGSCVALVGSNGAGKSTLFKIAANLLPVVSGKVSVFGHPLGVCHQGVVYLPQRAAIDWQFPMTVIDLVLTGRYVFLGWFKRVSDQDRQLALMALNQMGADDLAERQISQLSGGQQQRVLIARALVQDADLLLLDEPLNAVDVQTRTTVAKVLNQLRHDGKTVVIATHYADQEEGRYDGVIYLKDGEQVSPSDKPTDGPHGVDCRH